MLIRSAASTACRNEPIDGLGIGPVLVRLPKRGEILTVDPLSLGKRDCTLNDVAQFADVAGIAGRREQ